MVGRWWMYQMWIQFYDTIGKPLPIPKNIADKVYLYLHNICLLDICHFYLLINQLKCNFPTNPLVHGLVAVRMVFHNFRKRQEVTPIGALVDLSLVSYCKHEFISINLSIIITTLNSFIINNTIKWIIMIVIIIVSYHKKCYLLVIYEYLYYF